MSFRKLSPKQKRINELMKEANMHVRTIMFNDKERDAAQLRLNVARNKLYTSLIREYFKTALEKK